MCNTIRCRKIVQRFLRFHDLRHQLVDRCLGTICQKDRSGLCRQSVYMPNTILFLLFSCIFMLLDRAIQIIVYTGTRCDTRLSASIHLQLINIVSTLLILYKNPLRDTFLEQFFCLGIHLGCIYGYTILKLCLCAVYRQKG